MKRRKFMTLFGGAAASAPFAARAQMGIEIPASLLASANEVIE